MQQTIVGSAAGEYNIDWRNSHSKQQIKRW